MPQPANTAAPWLHRVPLYATLRRYRREDLPRDLLAGLVVGVVTVPQAVAYALLAGLPAQAGLYASLVPMVIYAVLGSSRQVVVGPVAIAALMVAATVSRYAVPYSDHYVGVTAMLSLEIGAVLLLLRLGRMGSLVKLISHPVIGGFVNAAAILIVVSQLPALLGLDGAGWPGALLPVMAALDGGFNPSAFAIGAASLVALILLRYGGKWFGRAKALARAGPLVVAFAAGGAAAGLALGVPTVGAVPAGLPAFTPPLHDAMLWVQLVPHAGLIAAVAYLETFAVGSALASRQLERVDGNQELLALSAANVGAAFCAACPVAGSFTRSSVNEAAGARTPVSSLVCALLVVATLLWLTPLFAWLPRGALAAIVVVSVWGLLDFGSLAQRWRFHRADVIAHFATLLGVLTIGIEAGLLLGVGVSVALFLRRSADPHIAVLGRLPGTPHFRNVDRYAVETWPALVVARVDESLHFANADQIETRLFALAQRDGVRHLVLVFSAVNFMDASGLAMLRRLAGRLRLADVALHLCEVKGPVRDQLELVALGAWLSGRVFRTTDEACNELSGAAGAWVWRAAETGPSTAR